MVPFSAMLSSPYVTKKRISTHGTNSSIRTLYVYWSLTLVQMVQILRWGDFGPLWMNLGPFGFKRIGIERSTSGNQFA